MYQPPLHEFAYGLDAVYTPLAQFGDALPDQVVIRPRGAEAIAACGQLSLHLGGELCQAIQQLGLAGRALSHHLLGNCSEIALCVHKLGADFARHGKREQGEHAIGFDFQQALQHAPGAAPAHAAIEQQKARIAIRMYAEIGKCSRAAVGEMRADQGMTGEMRRDRRDVRRVAAGQQGDMCRHD